MAWLIVAVGSFLVASWSMAEFGGVAGSVRKAQQLTPLIEEILLEDASPSRRFELKSAIAQGKGAGQTRGCAMLFIFLAALVGFAVSLYMLYGG